MTTKRVQQYMTVYGSEVPINCVFEKLMLESQASHIEEREPHIINQSFNFIKKHFDKHMMQVKLIDSRLWDMNRYRRYKERKWPALKERKGNKSVSSSKLSKNKIFQQPETLPIRPAWETVDSLDADKDSDPFVKDRIKPKTMKNPVQQQAHFEKTVDPEQANHQSTKSSDDFKGQHSYNPIKIIKSKLSDEVLNVYGQQSVDLPYDPREQRGLGLLQNNSQSKSNLGIRHHARGNSHEFRNNQGDIFEGGATHQYTMPGHGNNFQSPQMKALHLKDMNAQAYTKPPVRGPGIGLGGFPVSNQQPRSPPAFKRSETQLDPATSHLVHLGNPYLRKQKSTVVETEQYSQPMGAGNRGIQLKPLPSTSGHNYLAYQDHPQASQPRQRNSMFDDEDMSVFQDDRYRLLENKEVRMGSAGDSLDDSMIDDLNTLNLLLKAKPR